MPITPFHIGPGMLFKGVLQGSFSLMVFGWAQIVMDVQPLIVLMTGEGHLHGFSHTYIGSSILAIVAAISGKYLSELGLKILGVSKKSEPIKIIWKVAFLSAFIGTYSHVILDSFIHADMDPFYPLAVSNTLFGLVDFDQMHEFCLYSGLVGVAVYYFMQHLRKRIGLINR